MGQLLEMRIEQAIFGQQVLNTFQWAETTLAPLDGCAFALATAFGLVPVAGAYAAGTPFRKMRDMQNQAVSYVRWTIRRLYDVVDFYEAGALPATNGGQVGATDTMAPFNALGIKSNRVRTDVRAGHKRFAGVQEGMVDAGGIISTVHQALMATFCAAISVPLTVTISGQPYTFSSSILPKQTESDNAGDPGEFWPSYSEQVAKSAIGLTWSVMPQLRSQVSRQYGRGA